MTAVQHAASVHPQTVTEFSESPTRRRRRGNARSVSSDLRRTVVHPQVWAQALALCGGHPNRIEILDESNVYIHNDTGWRR